MCVMEMCFFFFQAEDGIRDLVRSRGLGDVYKRQRMFMATQLVLLAYLMLAHVPGRLSSPQLIIHALDLSLIHI